MTQWAFEMYVCKLLMGLEKLKFDKIFLSKLESNRTISELPSYSPLWLVCVRGLCYEYQFSFSLILEVIVIKKLHLDSIWKRDGGELGNCLLVHGLRTSVKLWLHEEGFKARGKSKGRMSSRL